MEPNASRDIIYAIRKICGEDGMKDARFMTANVDEVQEDERTISCTIVLGESELNLTDVGLQSEVNSDGFCLIPKVGTDVLVCLMPDNSAYVVLCNDIDKIICVVDSSNKFVFDSSGFVWNGGNKGGLVNVIDLTTKLNNLENLVNDLVLKYNTHIHPGGTISGNTAVTTSVETTTLTPTVRGDIEDTTINH